jgi:hypothetical protein
MYLGTTNCCEMSDLRQGQQLVRSCRADCVLMEWWKGVRVPRTTSNMLDLIGSQQEKLKIQKLGDTARKQLELRETRTIPTWIATSTTSHTYTYQSA